MKDSFVFYKSWIKAIRRLESSDSQMKVINAICDFTFDDTNFNESDFTNIELVALDTILPLIETAKKHYEDGIKGGRPKKEKTPLKTPLKTSLEPNDNDNVNFNVKDNSNDNANVNSNDNANVNSNDTEKEKVNNNDKDLKLLFTPPTLKEVQNFCMNQKLKTDPVEFWTYYNIRKWARIKNWQSQVMWWESRRFEKTTDYNSTDAIPSV